MGLQYNWEKRWTLLYLLHGLNRYNKTECLKTHISITMCRGTIWIFPFFNNLYWVKHKKRIVMQSGLCRIFISITVSYYTLSVKRLYLISCTFIISRSKSVISSYMVFLDMSMSMESHKKRLFHITIICCFTCYWKLTIHIAYAYRKWWTGSSKKDITSYYTCGAGSDEPEVANTCKYHGSLTSEEVR